MSGVNKAIIIGRLGADPDVKYTDSGVAVCKLSVATSETWKDKNSGEKQEKTEWHKIVMWRRLAEIAGEYLSKGSLVYLEGKLQTRSWETDAGEKRYMTEIVANQMQMLSSKGEGGGSQKAPKEYYGDPPPKQPGDDQDDIPF